MKPMPFWQALSLALVTIVSSAAAIAYAYRGLVVTVEFTRELHLPPFFPAFFGGVIFLVGIGCLASLARIAELCANYYALREQAERDNTRTVKYAIPKWIRITKGLHRKTQKALPETSYLPTYTHCA